jgi:hypothetical protein
VWTGSADQGKSPPVCRSLSSPYEHMHSIVTGTCLKMRKKQDFTN